MHIRRSITYGSGILALAGWGGTSASWMHHGIDAGVRPGFMVALSVGIAFTMVWSLCMLLPSIVKAYGIGHRDGFEAGMKAAQEAGADQRPKRRLSSV